ncbi:hypothetical protein HZH68_014318 [Vespula germanica]|uniref:Uncharacterized protein n=1 Tax=Vespula germanica TaxID=30212 RepID=A0A834JFM8_VESGE|nr:hypothetical protein HZH68_014318 [Vespula germanica]
MHRAPPLPAVPSAVATPPTPPASTPAAVATPPTHTHPTSPPRRPLLYGLGLQVTEWLFSGDDGGGGGGGDGGSGGSNGGGSRGGGGDGCENSSVPERQEWDRASEGGSGA